MSITSQKNLFTTSGVPSEGGKYITIGTVIDTNDPQQMGRCRVYCPALGDTPSMDYENLPWALYGSPVAGNAYVPTRGPGIQQSTGSVAYGFWAIPKVGASVLVFCLDGDYSRRVYIGGIYPQFAPHTMPHGRWMADDHPALEKPTGNQQSPHGPYTSSECFVEPYNTNARTAFSAKSDSHEWKTRVADYSVSGISIDDLDRSQSSVADDDGFRDGDWEYTQGYQNSRIDPSGEGTDKNKDSQVFSLTTPGFHALSMDDRQENCRVRLRTSTGHQIILDDTNERIYISTNQGNSWIEMDSNGNVDAYAVRVSVHAAKDINLTADETIRMHAGKGLHMFSGGDAVIETASGGSVYVVSGDSIHQTSAKSMHFQTGSTYNLTTKQDAIVSTGGNFHVNGPTAAPAEIVKAMWTNKVPQHEPYARVMTKDDYTHEPEMAYDDKNVGRIERGIRFLRGTFWRR